MKKLVIIFTALGLMFQVAGCTGKKAQDNTEVVENADVEKIEAEEANFAAAEGEVGDAGPVDESLQAALGEAPQVDDVAATPTNTETTESVDTATANALAPTTETEIAAAPAPSIDESAFAETPVTPSTEVAAGEQVDSGITETPVVDPALEPTQDVAFQTEPSLDTSASGSVTEMTPPTDTSSSFAETPVTETPSTYSSDVANESAVTAEATAQVAAPAAPVTAANAKSLRKIAETTPYQHGDGYVNTVYIARPKEKLKDISQTIYGMDKTKELKSINSFIKNRQPRAGEKIYYVSPNRPMDSTTTLSFYEDTGMMASTYVTQKGDTLPKVAKKLLGYENAWKEIWTTNAVESKGKLAAGETLRYWKPVDQPTTLADNSGNSKIIDSTQQLPVQPMPTQEVAMNTAPPQELPPPPPPQEEMPLPPPPPADMNAANAPPTDMNAVPPQELPPPPPADMNAANTPPPPPPQEVAAAPMPPKNKAPHNMEEELVGDEAMNQDTTMMMGVVVVLVAILGFVLVRRNKKKRDADMASIEQTHVGG